MPQRDPGRSPKRPVRRGDVLVSRLRPALRKSAVCPVDGLASPEIVAWVPQPGWRGVLAGRVLDPDIQARWAALGTGTRMPRVPGHQLGATDIGVPVAAAQELAPTVEPLVDQILRGVELAAALRALRDRALRDRLESTADPAAPLRATG